MTRALLTGGAGFLGSHLCDRLVAEGWEVVCLDNLSTGRKENIEHLLDHERYTFVEADVTHPIEFEGPLDWVLHFAALASPRDYLDNPIHSLKVGALGTLHGLGLAKAKGAGFFLASTSEVYGDPKVHPQPESYWGNVNPIGPRGVYDEAKRYAESMTVAYNRVHRIPVRIARIFNTYGPRMRRDDGRAVPTFIDQALRGVPLTVHGDGSQTRSLCYVDDMVEGLSRLLDLDFLGPVNLGNPEEVTVSELARRIVDLCGSTSPLEHGDRPVNDPEVRCPEIPLAQNKLGWELRVSLSQGLSRTIGWARGAGWAEASSESRVGDSRTDRRSATEVD